MAKNDAVAVVTPVVKTVAKTFDTTPHNAKLIIGVAVTTAATITVVDRVVPMLVNKIRHRRIVVVDEV